MKTLKIITRFSLSFLSVLLCSSMAFGVNLSCSHLLNPLVKVGRNRVRVAVDQEKRHPFLEELEAFLKSTVIGQDEVIDAILQGIEVLLVAGRSSRGAGGAIMLPGPTGVGKNYVLEQLAKFLEAKLIEIEGGDYAMEHQMTALIGAAPTFVGHGKTVPALTNAKLKDAASKNQKMKTPKGKQVNISLVAINELDKAHQSLPDWMLKAIDAGTNVVWTVPEGDAEGGQGVQEDLDLTATIIFVTTNGGAEEILEQSAKIEEEVKASHPEEYEKAFGVGAITHLSSEEKGFRDSVKEAIQKVFKRPEFIGRFDYIPIAWPLMNAGYHKILNLEMRKARIYIESTDAVDALPMRATKPAKNWLVSKVEKFYGARNVTKVVQKYVTSPIMRAIGSGGIQSNQFVAIDVADDNRRLDFFPYDSPSGIVPEPLIGKSAEMKLTAKELEVPAQPEPKNAAKPKGEDGDSAVPQQGALATSSQGELKNLLIHELNMATNNVLDQSARVESVTKIMGMLVNIERFEYSFARKIFQKMGAMQKFTTQAGGQFDYYSLFELKGLPVEADQVRKPSAGAFIVYSVLTRLENLSKTEADMLSPEAANALGIHPSQMPNVDFLSHGQLVDVLIGEKTYVDDAAAEN